MHPGWVSYADPERQRQFAREWVRARREAWFADKACVRCGSKDELELDHIDPALKVSHSIWSWSKSRFLAEVAKCQPLCHRCHLEKTFGGPVGTDANHGTRRRHDSGCRCVPCRMAYQDHKKRVVDAARIRRGLPPRKHRELPVSYGEAREP